MGSSISNLMPQNNETSIYCEYGDGCPPWPKSTRSRICLPCNYKNRTGYLKPQLLKVNSDGKLVAQNRPGGFVNTCNCTSQQLCKNCEKAMDRYINPPSTDDGLSSLEPYEPKNNYSKF